MLLVNSFYAFHPAAPGSILGIPPYLFRVAKIYQRRCLDVHKGKWIGHNNVRQTNPSIASLLVLQKEFGSI